MILTELTCQKRKKGEYAFYLSSISHAPRCLYIVPVKIFEVRSVPKGEELNFKRRATVSPKYRYWW